MIVISPVEQLKEASKNKHGSQYGETGVIEHLLNYLDIQPKFCVEFGAGRVSIEDGTANIRYFYDEYKN